MKLRRLTLHSQWRRSLRHSIVRERFGHLKAHLRCVPALRGLDPPGALPEPGNYRSDGL